MIILFHRHGKNILKILKDREEIKVKSSDPVELIWDCAEKYPEEIIVWCDETLEMKINWGAFPGIFHHDLIMASYAVKTRFIPDAIGYIDQLPFINISRKVHYGTWKMSADIGGIKGKTLLHFKDVFNQITNFEMLLNCVGKLGQQNGLFCYSTPRLLKISEAAIPLFPENFQFEKVVKTNAGNSKLRSTASTKELFSFVYSHYKSVRLFLLFWCFLKYEKKLPIFSFLGALFKPKFFQKEVDLSEVEIRSNRYSAIGKDIDVIIPTMGRRKYLLQVMEDLKQQTHLPRKVIVVEQNQDLKSVTDLPELNAAEWPFKILHHFIHQTGACNARNIALKDVSADWVFFADDDIRMSPTLLENSLKELKKLGAECLSLNCKQEGEVTFFSKIKQWGSFGSGTSIVNVNYCKAIEFDEIYEFGFGEDQDYGMQLRNRGCDIIYHPLLQLLHLKAPHGGFREVVELPWNREKPKPSPTLMVFMKKHYTPEQSKGYKTELFLRYYRKQEIKNPVNYIRQMNENWRSSEKWAGKLLGKANNKFIRKSV